MPTHQTSMWTGDFGREYTRRNERDPDEKNAVYLKNLGVTRTDLNLEFLEGLPRDASILEVGTNTGDLLLIMHEMGFTNLAGVEIQPAALATARRRVPGLRAVRAYAQSLPFATGSFDLVYTSGVLIHIAPADLDAVMAEVHRCSRRYVWGLEYFNETLVEVPYRDHADLLWKGDYAAMYQRRFTDLRLVRERVLKRLDDGNRDKMFLLEKA